ncbi:hypothetical protein FACS1894103_0770 [Campylobacterota bacterium]|nr:hypothetical protein FACS1894103_0770 [Campylobacterota bacterium]
MLLGVFSGAGQGGVVIAMVASGCISLYLFADKPTLKGLLGKEEKPKSVREEVGDVVKVAVGAVYDGTVAAKESVKKQLENVDEATSPYRQRWNSWRQRFFNWVVAD